MKTKTKKKPARQTGGFDAVAFFREIKEKLSAKMEGMNLEQQKEFMQQVRDGKITLK
ncbi:MAG TPA: hypothetical protein VFI78_05890 [Salinimicrobium sp.]|nr:hypothetical protein [Salinimicrobium sp.]